MAGDELMRGLAVAMLAPALGEHEFFLRLQHRKLPDLLQIAAEVAFRRMTNMRFAWPYEDSLDQELKSAN